MDTINRMFYAIHYSDVDALQQVWDADVANTTYATGERDDTSRGINGYYPLHYAVHFGRVVPVRFMLENGADPNIRTVMRGTTPIRGNFQWGIKCFSIIRLLLKHGANPYIKNEEGLHALSPDVSSFEDDQEYLESYLVVELVCGEADNLPLDMWRVVKTFVYTL